MGHFRVALSPCFTREAECETSDMKRIFSHANKSHFHNKGFIFSLFLTELKYFGSRKWPYRVSVKRRLGALAGVYLFFF